MVQLWSFFALQCLSLFFRVYCLKSVSPYLQFFYQELISYLSKYLIKNQIPPTSLMPLAISGCLPLDADEYCNRCTLTTQVWCASWVVLILGL